MKTKITLLFSILGMQIAAQTSLPRTSRKFVDLTNKNQNALTYEPKDIFTYEESNYTLLANMNAVMKASVLIPQFLGSISFQGINSSRIPNFNLNGAFGRKYDNRTVCNGLTLVRVDENKVGKNASSVIKLKLPKKLEDESFQYVTSNQNKNLIHIFLETHNSKLQQRILFRYTYNLTDKSSSIHKIFNSNHLNDGIVFLVNNEKKFLTFIYGGQKQERFNYSFVSFNEANEIIGYAVDKHFNLDLRKEKIQKVLVLDPEHIAITTRSNDTEQKFINSLFNQEYISRVLVLTEHGSKDILIPGKKYRTSPKLFLKGKELGYAFLEGDKNKDLRQVQIGYIDYNLGKVKQSKVLEFNDINLLIDKFQARKLKNAKKTDKKKERIEKNAYEDYKDVSDLMVSEDGKIFLLLEAQSISEKTSTTRTTNSNGSTSYSTRTRTYYQYGPGNILLFDENLDYKKTVQFKYSEISSIPKEYFPLKDNTGSKTKVLAFDLPGMNFIPLRNEVILLKNSSGFIKHDLSNKDLIMLIIKKKHSEERKKMFSGSAEISLLKDSLLSIVNISHKTKLNITNYKTTN